MANLTLRQLRYFDAIARLGQFGRAAEACAVTQPALSMQIKELETELGVLLIERRPRGIHLTPEGREIAQRASDIITSVNDLADYARAAGGLMNGELRFGVIPSIAPYMLPLMLPELDARFPKLQLNVRETQTHNLLAELLHGDLDVLLLALPVEPPDIETLHLFDDRFLLAMQASEADNAPKRATAAMLEPERLLLLEDGHCLRDQALNYCQMIRPDALSGFGASSLATIVQMVANGHGITLLPEMCAALEARDERVALLRFAKPEPKREIGLAWRKSATRKRDFEALGAVIEEVARRHIAASAQA